MDDRELLGRRIKELRQMRRMSQEELAEQMGSAAKYLSSLERGRENPTLEMLGKVARGLKVDLVDLFNYPWLRMTEADLRRRIRALADHADLDRLREVLAVMKSREL